MTKLLEQAFDAARRLDPALQDDIARAVMMLAGEGEPAAIAMSSDERAAVARSRAAAARGEFATDEQVRGLWAKHRL